MPDRPIGDYALIGDCRSVALVSRDGSIDWLCWPNFSSPSVFSALLDFERGGHFSIRPTEPHTIERRYVEATAVLETTFTTAHAVVRLTDLMPILERSTAPVELQPMRELLRTVEVVEGSAELEIEYEPRPDYARVKPRLEERGELGWACRHRDTLLMLSADVALEATADGSGLRSRVSLVAGDRRTLSLAFDSRDMGVAAPLGRQAERRVRATLDWWADWAAMCTYDGPHADAVLRSAITLKLLSYAPSGAMIAAATTSLPESAGAGRNWDYRYCWLRDASLTFQVFTDLGFRAEGEAYLTWLLNATRLTWPKLQVLYDLYGRPDVPEHELTHLQGWRGSRPVRIGNAAGSQLQLDVYGEVILAAFDYVDRGGQLERSEARFLVGLGKTVCRRWREPDQGIWELRDEPRHNTHSKLMCWAALDRLARLHRGGHVQVDLQATESEREAARRAIERDGFNEALGSYVAAFGGSEADASLLLMARHGFHPPDHPRLLGTYEFVDRALGRRDGLMLRYASESDAMTGEEGAFGVCGFWAIEYLAMRGDRDAAQQRLEQQLSFANDVGLFAEEIDVASGAALGNFPQAFTHLGMISAALLLGETQAMEGSAQRARA